MSRAYDDLFNESFEGEPARCQYHVVIPLPSGQVNHQGEARVLVMAVEAGGGPPGTASFQVTISGRNANLLAALSAIVAHFVHRFPAPNAVMPAIRRGIHQGGLAREQDREEGSP